LLTEQASTEHRAPPLTSWLSKMANDNSVYLVYSADDGAEWSKYLMNVLSEVSLGVKYVELDSSGALPATFKKFRRGRVIVLLASPGFVKSLADSQSHRLDKLINQDAAHSAELVVLFLCGTSIQDFQVLDSQGKPLSERFPGLNSWTAVKHEDSSRLPQTVGNKVECISKKNPKHPAHEPQKKPPKIRPKMNFNLVPDEVRCEVWNL